MWIVEGGVVKNLRILWLRVRGMVEIVMREERLVENGIGEVMVGEEDVRGRRM